jgi:hypothetical protein
MFCRYSDLTKESKPGARKRTKIVDLFSNENFNIATAVKRSRDKAFFFGQLINTTRNVRLFSKDSTRELLYAPSSKENFPRFG